MNSSVVAIAIILVIHSATGPALAARVELSGSGSAFAPFSGTWRAVYGPVLPGASFAGGVFFSRLGASIQWRFGYEYAVGTAISLSEQGSSPRFRGATIIVNDKHALGPWWRATRKSTAITNTLVCGTANVSPIRSVPFSIGLGAILFGAQEHIQIDLDYSGAGATSIDAYGGIGIIGLVVQADIVLWTRRLWQVSVDAFGVLSSKRVAGGTHEPPDWQQLWPSNRPDGLRVAINLGFFLKRRRGSIPEDPHVAIKP